MYSDGSHIEVVVESGETFTFLTGASLRRWLSLYKKSPVCFITLKHSPGLPEEVDVTEEWRHLFPLVEG